MSLLAAIKLGEKLLDRAPCLEHRSEPLAAAPAAGRGFVNARLEIAGLIAALLDLREALRLREPPLQRVDGVFRIGAGEMMHGGFGIDLRFCQLLDALAHAVQPQLERFGRLALPHQRVA